MKKLKFILVGHGKHGKRWEKVLGDSLAYIVDPSENTMTLDEALAFNDTDAVVVVTPHDQLAPITEKCLRAGRHVLCEKPGAITSKQIDKNMMLADKKGLYYKIGYNYRFHDGFIKARKLYEKNAIGELVFIRASHGFGGRKGYEKEWRINKKIGGGGHLHDQGVHMIDMVCTFLGEVRVKSFIADNYWGAGTEDNAFVLLQNRHGVIASIHSSLTQWKSLQKFEIYGTKGYLIIEGLGTKYGRGDFGYNMGERLILGKRAKDYVGLAKEKIIKCNTDPDRSLELELKEFISNIRDIHNSDPSRLTDSSWEAYKTLRVVEEVYRTNL
jgi:predicted dehydrogenase